MQTMSMHFLRTARDAWAYLKGYRAAMADLEEVMSPDAKPRLQELAAGAEVCSTVWLTYGSVIPTSKAKLNHPSGGALPLVYPQPSRKNSLPCPLRRSGTPGWVCVIPRSRAPCAGCLSARRVYRPTSGASIQRSQTKTSILLLPGSLRQFPPSVDGHFRDGVPQGFLLHELLD